MTNREILELAGLATDGLTDAQIDTIAQALVKPPRPSRPTRRLITSTVDRYLRTTCRLCGEATTQLVPVRVEHWSNQPPDEDPGQAAAIQDHTDSCPACQARIANANLTPDDLIALIVKHDAARSALSRELTRREERRGQLAFDFPQSTRQVLDRGPTRRQIIWDDVSMSPLPADDAQTLTTSRLRKHLVERGWQGRYTDTNWWKKRFGKVNFALIISPSACKVYLSQRTPHSPDWDRVAIADFADVHITNDGRVGGFRKA